MPAIDLARLKKQVAQLTDLYNRPDEFVRALHGMLDFYVNRSLREVDSVAPSSVLETYRTPPVILKHIETELAPLAAANPDQALDLADHLWDDGWLEMRLIAASLLGRLPPREERLLPRLTAWTMQVRDPSVRAGVVEHQSRPSAKGNARSFPCACGRMAPSRTPAHVVERNSGSPASHSRPQIQQPAACL